MQCPRCGHEAAGMARACVACGYMLPFSLRQLRQMRDAQQGHPAPDGSPDAESGGTPADFAALTDLAATGPAPVTGADWPSADPIADSSGGPRHPSPPTRPLSVPPPLQRIDDVGREATAVLPSLGSEPSPVSPSFGSNPSGGLPGAASWAGLPPLPPSPHGSAAGGTGKPEPELAPFTTSVLAALNVGTLLKSGRYRLLERFTAATPSGQRGEPEPPLCLASDTERPSARVLIQELPLADVRPDFIEQVFRRAITRLELAGQSSVLPPLLDSFLEKGHGFVVFHVPTGERLSEYLQSEGPLTEAEAIDLGLRLLDALATLESLSPPIIHANLSPDNVLLQRNGKIVLVGLSPTLLVRGSGSIERGAAGGVRGYAAPEQQRGQADARSDLFAVAAILYHATTGQRLAQHSGALYESARTLNPNISAAFDAILAQALRPAAAQRMQSVAEFRYALSAVQPAPTQRGLARARSTAGSPGPSEMKSRALPGAAGALRATMQHPAVSLRRRRSGAWVALAALILVSVLGAGVMYALRLSPPSVQTTAIPTENPTATALFHRKGIGLSAGEFVFDAARPDAALKQRGAQAMAAHNPQAARAAFQQAMAVDKTDAEAALYAANAQVALSGTPYITIVAAVAFGADSDGAESELQGIALAQQRINALDLLPGTTRLSVLVANAGRTASDVAQVAQLIVAAATGANAEHIVGVVGWPDTDQAPAAATALAAAHIPLVAPAAPAASLSSPVYFALGPSDAQQGQALADAATTVLHSHRVLVLRDPADTRSATLAQAFAKRAQQQRPATMTITGQESFSTGRTTDFTQAVSDAALGGNDTILLAGNDADTAYLAQAVAQETLQTNVAMHIIAPTWANSPRLLGVGPDAIAQLVRHQSEAMTAVYVATLASVGEWSVVGVAAGEQPTFYTDYAQQFGANAAPGGLSNPDATAILAYDAARLLGAAAAHAQHGAVLPGPATIVGALAGTQGSGAFQGVGGAISFAGPGAPVNKALALLSLAALPGAPGSGPALATTVVAVLGGSEAFCGGPTCIPG